MTDQIETLNEHFAITGHVRFFTGKNGLPMARIENALATAEVYLYGAHITAFQPKGDEPVMWMSPLVQFQPGKAIRGGVPVIWPWFGPHATDSTKPSHGFVRTMEWQVNSTEALPDGSTQVRFLLTDNAATLALWPHAFELSLLMTVGSELTVDLTCRNTSDQSLTLSGAMHTYFAVTDVTQMVIEGLAGREYIDQLDGRQIKRQTGDIHIRREVDRIYVNSDDTCIIHDAVLSRQIKVRKAGSQTTVVWNPWIEKARTMADFPDEGYQHMVCIEAANAADDVVRLAPGEEHTLSQMISVEH